MLFSLVFVDMLLGRLGIQTQNKILTFYHQRIDEDQRIKPSVFSSVGLHLSVGAARGATVFSPKGHPAACLKVRFGSRALTFGFPACPAMH